MLHLHHLENSRSFRILWLLEELNTDYKLTCYQRNKAYLAPKSLKKIHQLGQAPILEVNERALVESGFIIEYLLKEYDNAHLFKPSKDDTAAWEDYTFWMHFAEASVMPLLVMRLVFTKVVEKSPMIIKPISKGIRKQVENSMIRHNLTTMLDMMEQQLQNNHWFAGAAFSGADIQMYIPVVAANAGAGLDAAKYANLLNWLKRCQERAAFKIAVTKGGQVRF